MIYAVVKNRLYDNVYSAITSTGKAITAYNVDPSNELILGSQAGIIQCGDIYTVFSTDKRLRNVISIENEKEYALTDKWQYFAAKIGIALNNIVRFYEIASVVSVTGSDVSATIRGVQSTFRLASWIEDVQIGDDMLYDVELDQIVGFACRKELGYRAITNSFVEIPICDEYGNIILDPISVVVVRNSIDEIAGIIENIVSNDGYINVVGFLPDDITIRYNHNGKDYYHNIVLTDIVSYTQYTGQTFLVALSLQNNENISFSFYAEPDKQVAGGNVTKIEVYGSGKIREKQNIAIGIGFSGTSYAAIDTNRMVYLNGAFNGLFTGDNYVGQEYIDLPVDVNVTISAKSASGLLIREYKDGTALAEATSSQGGGKGTISGISTEPKTYIEIDRYMAEVVE